MGTMVSRPASPVTHAGTASLGLAVRLLRYTGNVWSREGLRERAARQLYLKVIAEAKRQKSKGALPDFDEIRKNVKQPTTAEVTQAWIRRLIYTILIFVMVSSDYILIASRSPVIFGGTPPDILKPFLPYLQTITGVSFVSIAAICGLLIQEYSAGLADVVRIEPNVPSLLRRIKLNLAIFMFVLDMTTVIFLTTTGVILQFGVSDPKAIYVVFISNALLTALGVFLGWSALIAGLQGLATLLLIVPALMLCLISAAFLIVSSVIQGMGLWWRSLVALSIPQLSSPSQALSIAPQPLQARLFISYSRADLPFVDRLERSFKDRGLITWVDRQKLKGGQQWLKEIQEAIDQCNVIIAVLSPDAVESEWVDMELYYAHQQHKVIVPLILRECKVPILLSTLHFISFERTPYDQAFTHVLDAIIASTH